MEVATLQAAVDGEMQRQVLQAALGLKNADHFRKATWRRPSPQTAWK
jgi:hypothetical protein